MSSQNPKGKTGKLLLLIVLVILLVGAGVFVGLNWNRWFGKQAEDVPQGGLTVDQGAEDWTGEQDVYEGEKNTDTIDIPGYGSITLKAAKSSL